MSIERERLQSPTDALITAMEEADDIEHVIVIATKRDGCITIVHNDASLSTLMGMNNFASIVLARRVDIG